MKSHKEKNNLKITNSRSRRQSGQGLIEYLILVAIMAVAGLTVVKVLGQNVSAQFGNIARSLQGGDKAKQQEKLDEVKQEHTRQKDMSDFMAR